MDPIRIIHDFKTRVKGGVSSQPILTEVPQDTLIEKRPFQSYGVAEYSNQLEDEFYGDAYVASKYTYPEVPFYRLKDVVLTGYEASIFTSKGQHLQLCDVCAKMSEKSVRLPIRALSGVCETPVLHLCGPNRENHGHFILDYLPKLLGAKQVLKEHPETKILLPKDQIKWQMKYLQKMGIGAEQIIEKDAGTLKVSDLWYAAIPNADGHLASPELTLSVRDALEENTRYDGKAGNVPVFVTRRDAPNKRVLNEEELIAAAKDHLPKLQVVELSELTLADQIRLFQSASHVIGAVGQGLVNILFSRGAKVLVLTFEQHLEKPRSWSKAYGNLGLLAGNQTLALTSGAERDEKGNYHFPQNHFVEAIKHIL